MKKSLGLSILELLMVLAVLGIFIAFSVPTYSHYITRLKRLEATHTMIQAALALQKYYFSHYSFAGASLADLGFRNLSQYQLTLQLPTENEFKIMGKPILRQAIHDKDCATLILDSEGKKTITGMGNVATCWA